MQLYTDLNIECCAWLGARVEDGSLPPGDVLLADVRDLRTEHLCGYSGVHLFAGIGGFPLGLAWAGWPHDRSIITFGFPCQDISAAGKGAGLDGKRSGLFWEAVRLLAVHQPEVCIAENVGALSVRGLDTVAAAMGEAGYVVPEAYRVGAWAVGAPHERERWWIVGYRIGPQHDSCTRGLRAVGKLGEGPIAHQSGTGGAFTDSGIDGREPWTGDAGDEGRSRGGRDQSAASDQILSDTDRQQGRLDEPERGPQRRTAAGWRDPPTGPWRRDGDEWFYSGPPVLVYSAGQQRLEGHRTNTGESEVDQPWSAGAPDPTAERGWPVPVLPGYQQREWEHPRLHQRGVGCAIHGVPGPLADSLNKCGVMAVGNAIVPQVLAAIARGIKGE